MTVIEVRDVTKTYGAAASPVEALRGINLAVNKGELLAITGPSGSGKSTLLHILGGVDAPTAGQVLFAGVDLASLSDDHRTIIRRRRIGFIFQSFNLVPTLTVEENVVLPLRLDSVPAAAARHRAQAALEAVGMLHRRTHLPCELSGGEQQRTAIARACVIEPALLLADEPTGNLDSANGAQVMTLLGDLVRQRQHTVIIITHDLAVAAQADRLVRLRDGRIVDDLVQVSDTAGGSEFQSEEFPQ
jgi:putative ABC transport system ATP-binding protein